VVTAYSAANGGPGKPRSTGSGLRAQTVTHSTLRSKSPGQLRCPPGQFCAHGHPSSRSRPHYQERRPQKKPMEPNRGGGRKHRGDYKRGELQHSDHDVPPDLRFGESHGYHQSHCVDRERLTDRRGLSVCVGHYTPCRAGRATSSSACRITDESRLTVAQRTLAQGSAVGVLAEPSCQKIWRRMPRVSSASVAERCRRRTRRRIFSSVGAGERRFREPLGCAFK